jgi:recombination associated protein RdgC
MFKNLLVYRLGPQGPSSMAQIEQALERDRFVECGRTQPLSAGWVEPRGVAHGPLIEVVGGQWLLALQIEQRLLPAAVVRRRADELAARIEKEVGRKPGKKQMRELKDQATLDLLPQSFTKRAGVRIWIAPAERLLMVDAGSAARADLALTQLAKSLDGVSAQPMQTTLSPAVAMAEWLAAGEAPAGFTIDRDCELKRADGEKPTVRYARHALDIDEIRGHLKDGKQPTKLALTWQGRVSFVLNDAMQIRKVAFDDGVFEGRRGDHDAFDADAAIATGELAPMIAALIDGLGGEQQLPALKQAA